MSRKTDAPGELALDDRRQIVRWVRRQARDVDARYGRYLRRGPGGIADQIEQCLDWHRSEGKRRSSWPAAIRNWLRKDIQFRAERGQDERPVFDLDKRQPTRVHVTDARGKSRLALTGFDDLGDVLGPLFADLKGGHADYDSGVEPTKH